MDQQLQEQVVVVDMVQLAALVALAEAELGEHKVVVTEHLALLIQAVVVVVVTALVAQELSFFAT
jgi:hypothetical protein